MIQIIKSMEIRDSIKSTTSCYKMQHKKAEIFFLKKIKQTLPFHTRLVFTAIGEGSDEMFSLVNNRCLNLTEVAAQHFGCLSLVTGNNKNQRPTLNSNNVYSRVAKSC